MFSDNGAKVFEPVSLGVDLPNYLQVNNSPSRYERIAAVNQYLARQGSGYPFKDAAALLLNHAGVPGRPADKTAIERPIDLNRDPEYRATLEGKAKLRDAVIALMDRYDLDALIYPHKLHGPLKIGPRDDPERNYVPNQLSPTTGLPALVVPMGFTPEGLPIGLEILGRPWSEPTLIKLASGFEAVTKNRKVPAYFLPLLGEHIEYRTQLPRNRLWRSLLEFRDRYRSEPATTANSAANAVVHVGGPRRHPASSPSRRPCSFSMAGSYRTRSTREQAEAGMTAAFESGPLL